MIVWIYLLAIALQYNAIDAITPKPHVQCVRSYQKLGCFSAKSKPLSELLITNRDPKSPQYDGHVLDWQNWEEYTHSLACRCADKARERNFTEFGLQNYAECWSGPGAEESFDDHKGLSNMCLMIRKKTYGPCEMKDSTDCVGQAHANFIYKLDVDVCAGDPCHNGATCLNTVGGFQCKCPAGFTGKRCEQDKDECKKSPCKNGGSCVNTQGSFRCDCRKGFKGNLCEQDKDECKKSPCKNGGSCVNTQGSFRCDCRKGFKGNLCLQDKDECKKSPCKNGGSCVNTQGSFTCDCGKGFKGNLCEQDEDECKKSPCKNGGSCVNTQGSFTCDCRKGFKGNLCEQDEDECKKSPCKNGGSCVNTQGSFRCDCRKGFKGNLCEQDKDECKKSPCKNGGSCVNSQGSCCVKHDIYDLGILIIDNSGSVSDQGVSDTNMFLIHLIGQFPVNKKITSFGIIACSDKPKLICKFSDRLLPNSASNFKWFLKTKVMFLEWQCSPHGHTRIDKALKLAGRALYDSSSGGDDPNVTNVLVVIAYGNTAQGSEPYKDVLKPLKDREVNIFAVGVGNNVSKEELVQIAMGREDRVMSVPGIQDLDASKLHERIEDIC